MRRLTLLRFFALSIIVAIVLSILSFVCLRIFAESAADTHRQTFATALAKDIEGRPYPEAVLEYNRAHQGTRSGHNQIWIVDGGGKILAANNEDTMPADWNDISKPEGIHDFTVKYNWLSITPELTCIRLLAPQPTFLVVRTVGRRSQGLLFFAPLLITFIMVALTVFWALTLIFFYLQKKSTEAKEVLARLEKGDLKARFKIQRFDEIGNLMLDFNRMASEIERLIGRVQETETARRNLLQELSHDLRTPLTGLRTSIETLRYHFEQMSPEDRGEFFAMVDGELHYFVQLVEDLFFIADLDEPRYKATTAKIDLVDLVGSEIKARQTGMGKNLQWTFEFLGTEYPSAWILGDWHLILRLIKNALDNSFKYATKSIQVRLLSLENEWLIEIQDDGSGLDPEQVKSFGKRRQNRLPMSAGSLHFSLGLGSVIMKSIAELHHGRIELQDKKALDSKSSGTILRVYLPKAKTL